MGCFFFNAISIFIEGPIETSNKLHFFYVRKTNISYTNTFLNVRFHDFNFALLVNLSFTLLLLSNIGSLLINLKTIKLIKVEANWLLFI